MSKSAFLILIIIFIAFNSAIQAEQLSNEPIETRISQLETLYNIQNKTSDNNLRIDIIDMKAIGLKNEGSISHRLDILEKNHAKQLKQCVQPLTKPDHTPIINQPEKNLSNPVKYDYKPEYGNYFTIIKSQIAKQGYDPKDYHFKTFPITYSIKSSNPEFLDIIQSSLKEYKKIIPIKEVNANSNPDIKIEIIDKEKMASITGDGNKLGINKTGTKTQNGEVVDYKSEVFLNKKIFDYPMSIYASSTINHEFLHALGLSGHSKSPYDILYPQIDVNILYGAQVALIKRTCQTKDFNQFVKLSQRDLNTLWLLYNFW